jgi:hypothetical protein
LENSPEEVQNSINQRLKFLIQELNISARAFSATIGVPDTTTRNYLDKNTKLNADYLEKIVHHFKEVNLNWLVTGEGEHFIPGVAKSVATRQTIKNNYGNNVGSNRGGTVTQHHIGTTSPEERDNKLALAEKEIESLRTQLAMQAALLASKDETIAVLKSAFNRPN